MFDFLIKITRYGILNKLYYFCKTKKVYDCGGRGIFQN